MIRTEWGKGLGEQATLNDSNSGKNQHKPRSDKLVERKLSG